MQTGPIFHAPDRQAWREWLQNHGHDTKEIWLRYYKKASGVPSVSYDDAVEEALCFGWIDGLTRSLDELSFVQRYTPRRAKSNLSELNRQRILKLERLGLMTAAGRSAVQHLMPDPDTPWIIPPDILAALQEDPVVWANFQAFPESYQRLRIGFVLDCRRQNPAESDKRLRHLIRMTAQNKQFGTIVE